MYAAASAAKRPRVGGGGASDSAAAALGGGVVSVGSFTKILAPGLRLGWLEASPAVLTAVASRGYLVSGGGVAPLASEIVGELLRDGGQAEHLAHLRATFAASAAALSAALSAEGCFDFDAPRGGYFCWVRLPDGVAAAALLPVAERHGVTFLPGPTCAPTAPEAFARRVRLCFAYESEVDIVEGVRRLAVAVRELQGDVAPRQREVA